mmetsp:Transcript_31856/g.64861  ORF Transcript_31856/g.64861 Transcript_31856/m.64861 type:complete len:692 (-) Transcript_31856:257-2332(-)
MSSQLTLGSNDGDDINAPVVPTLESLPSVVWEQVVSFLNPSEVLLASYRVSKSLGGATKKGKQESVEKGAKLALGSMLMQAWAHDIKSNQTARQGVVGNGDDIEPPDKGDTIMKLPRIEGESFLRTYHLALSCVHAGEDVVHVVEKSDISLSPEENDEHNPLFITMWLLYGMPLLPPLSDGDYDIAGASAMRIADIIGPNPTSTSAGRPADDEIARSTTKTNLDKYCRGRILRVADRLRKIGLWIEGMHFLSILTYGRLSQISHAVDSDFFIGSRVILCGLSKANLNGTRGMVASAYNPSSKRIGVRLIDSEKPRLVGINPINLRSQEVDTDIVIDQKITSAFLGCAVMDSAPDSVFSGISRDVHGLRKIVPALRIKANEEKGWKEELVLGDDNDTEGGGAALFSCNLVRLCNALLALSMTLAHFANHVGNDRIETNHGGVVCQNYEVICEKFGDDRNLMVMAFFSEAAEVVDELRKLIVSSRGREIKDRGEEVANEEILPMHHQLWNYMIVDAEIAYSQIVTMAGILTFTREVPFLDFDNAADLGVVIASHLRSAVATQRSWLDTFLYSLAQKDGPPLSIHRICTKQRGRMRQVIKSAAIIGEVYVSASTLVDISPFRASSEDGDGIPFFQLALALSLRTLGSGHIYTKKLANVLRSYGEDDGMEERECLEGDVDAWLSGGYEYLYLTDD